MANARSSETRHTPHERVALLLQGGGALGSYHHGVYEALAATGYTVDWFAGTSIGGIQAAILAGNPPGDVLATYYLATARASTAAGAPGTQAY